MSDIGAVLDFLHCRTPSGWLRAAAANVDALLHDHAALELKAAQQAQKIIWKYGATDGRRSAGPGAALRGRLMSKMSRLAREELRHFEQVLAELESRGSSFRPVRASRYAAGLHEAARRQEPGALVDTLLIGAIIEARSCERFHSLLAVLENEEPALARFYSSLLRSEARHFEDYLQLAQLAAEPDEVHARAGELLQREAELILGPDGDFRFHSGVPASGGISPESPVRQDRSRDSASRSRA